MDGGHVRVLTDFGAAGEGQSDVGPVSHVV